MIQQLLPVNTVLSSAAGNRWSLALVGITGRLPCNGIGTHWPVFVFDSPPKETMGICDVTGVSYSVRTTGSSAIPT